MYIRQTSTKIKGKVYSTYQVVKSIRTPQGPRQIVLCSIKDLKIPREQWKVLGKYISLKLKDIEMLPGIFSSAIVEEGNRIIDKIKSKKVEIEQREQAKLESKPIQLTKIETSDCKEIGTVHVGYEMWKRLKIDEILKEVGFNEKYRKLACIQVIGRLVEPKSELGTVNWVKQTGLGEILDYDLNNLNEDVLYRVSDKLLRKQEEIEKRLARVEEDLFHLDGNIILYDLTSSYFEGEELRNELADFGHSKDKRSDCKQVVVGLVLDNEGFLKMHNTYRGNISETKTLMSMIKDLEKKFGKEAKTIVIDKGLSSDENLKELAQGGYKYIAAVKGNDKEKFYNKYEKGEYDNIEKIDDTELYKYEECDEVYLMYRSLGRQEKEKSIREKFMERMAKDLVKLENLIDQKRLKDENKIRIRIGKIRQKYNRVSRFYQIEYDGNKLIYKKDEEKLKSAERLDGILLLKTNRKDMSLEEIIKTYRLLTRVEDSFRSLKTVLKIRPIYHQKKNRTEGHIFITILAYHLLWTIMKTLRDKNENSSWETIKNILKTQQLITVSLPGQNEIYEITQVSRANDKQREIYEKLKISSQPLEKKISIIRK